MSKLSDALSDTTLDKEFVDFICKEYYETIFEIVPEEEFIYAIKHLEWVGQPVCSGGYDYRKG